MCQKHNKLIRDRIPEMIRQTGRECEIETMSQTDYHQALLKTHRSLKFLSHS